VHFHGVAWRDDIGIDIVTMIGPDGDDIVPTLELTEQCLATQPFFDLFQQIDYFGLVAFRIVFIDKYKVPKVEIVPGSGFWKFEAVEWHQEALQYGLKKWVDNGMRIAHPPRHGIKFEKNARETFDTFGGWGQ
jgi:hypothetical protein